MNTGHDVNGVPRGKDARNRHEGTKRCYALTMKRKERLKTVRIAGTQARGLANTTSEAKCGPLVLKNGAKHWQTVRGQHGATIRTTANAFTAVTASDLVKAARCHNTDGLSATTANYSLHTHTQSTGLSSEE
jgi:hypothetical protein